MKLHRKIEHNEKVCWAQKLGYYAQGQGHNHVRCQIELKIRSEMTSYVLCKTLVPWLCSRSQPGIKVIIRDLQGQLLHTVTFLVVVFFSRSFRAELLVWSFRVLNVKKFSSASSPRFFDRFS